MKIALGSRPYDGPWGGGNRFIAALCDGLHAAGHIVVHNLKDNDIDFIVLTDPRSRSPNVCFGAGAILRYLATTNSSAIVIHRINECDERKGEAFINAKLVRANYCADWTVFVGEWLTTLPIWREHLRTPWHTIRNGADTRIFNADGFAPWNGDGPLRLVTHHWGFHRMKGFDVYEAIDRALDDPALAARFAFTYVGNLPKGFVFRNARYVTPLNGISLAAELRAHHAYVTGSINEPGGNHQNEGALCGLPLLYRNSGCMPEYCTGFGLSYDGPQDIRATMENLATEYRALVDRMPAYPHTAERMIGEWIELFEHVVGSRDATLERRRPLLRRPAIWLRNMVPL